MDSPYLGPPKESQICFSSAASPTRDALWKLGSFDNFQDENTSLELFWKKIQRNSKLEGSKKSLKPEHEHKHSLN